MFGKLSSKRSGAKRLRSAAENKRRPKAITFDCYGTLIDWEAGLKRTLSEILLGESPRDVSAESVFRRWR
ncbi:MAG: hypothetical protein ACE5H0_03215, partial [Bacteroidota bacterium]